MKGYLLVSLVLLLYPAVSTVRPYERPPDGDENIVQRFLARTEAPLTTYKVLRRLSASNERFNKRGWVEAWTTLGESGAFSYQIAAEGGSAYVRNKVLRKVLEREAEAHAAGETGAAAIAPTNYEFGATTYLDGLASISLKPRRKDPLLLTGALYLTPDDADLVRVEGQLAKTPSFWTRRVQIVRRYGRIDNVRVPLVMESTAQVLVVGESSFMMRYEYAWVNGREVGQPQPSPSEPEAPGR